MLAMPFSFSDAVREFLSEHQDRSNSPVAVRFYADRLEFFRRARGASDIGDVNQSRCDGRAGVGSTRRDGSHRLHRPKVVIGDPDLGDHAVAKVHDVDAVDADRPAGGRHP